MMDMDLEVSLHVRAVATGLMIYQIATVSYSYSKIQGNIALSGLNTWHSTLLDGEPLCIPHFRSTTACLVQ